MSATLFRNHKVFRMNAGIPYAGMFPSDTVIVASESCENNVCPHSYQWRIEFIGSEDDFTQRYIPRTAYYFSDGLSRADDIQNGTAFRKRMAELFAVAEPLTIANLHDQGWHGYSWDVEKLLLFPESEHFTLHTDWLGTRLVCPLSNDADIARMLAEADKVLGANNDHIWMGGLWEVSARVLDNLNTLPAADPVSA